jgi:hypothetical protein
MATKEPPASARNAPAQASGRRAAKPASSGSFLDDWLNKRRIGTPPPSISPAKTPLPPQPQPTAPAAANQFQPTQTPTQAAPAVQNISSNEIEQVEVSKIVAELKQQLDTPQAPAPETPEEPEEPKLKLRPKAKTEHTFDLKPGKDDTIFIDQDGSFRELDADKK